MVEENDINNCFGKNVSDEMKFILFIIPWKSVKN